eukprot:m.45174 g.45174  ORF g.45174 m.45174 type:complete len:436 (-) comp5862_c0_seq2:55-1362(-)
MAVRAVVLLAVLAVCAGIDNGVGWLPPMGWSTWNTFRFNISTTLIMQSADFMAKSALKTAGYEYILIDDGWPACAQGGGLEKCQEPAPRDADGRIPIDQSKFPGGFKPLTDYVHSLGLKIGIYTAVSARTCGGYSGSLGHERVDAQSFADWGFDFVKHDTCNTDCPIHNGCIQNSTALMQASLNATGRPIVYYIDSGNPTSPQRTFNPHQHSVVSQEALQKLATSSQELVWVWAKNTAHMFKSWFDSFDAWESMLTNSHNQIRVAEYQSCGRFNMPDMLTIGQGAQSLAEYRAQMAIWVVLGAPLIIGCDIRTIQNDTLALLTNREALAINQDPDCIQGSLARAPDATEVWTKPLHDGSFAVALLNKGKTEAIATLQIGPEINGGDFFPATIQAAHIRDVFSGKDLGVHYGEFNLLVGAHDAALLRVTPVASREL